MLLKNHSEKLINLLNYFDELSEIDKLMLSINILESDYLKVYFDKDFVINLLKKQLYILDEKLKTTIINFSKYKKLTFLSAMFIELSEEEKPKFIVEMLFNIYETDFKNDSINEDINQNLDVYSYAYSVMD